MADPKLERFLAEISPHIRGDYGVQLVPELEPCSIAFDRETPDRLYCGRAVFDDMVARGVLVKAPVVPRLPSLPAPSITVEKSDTAFRPRPVDPFDLHFVTCSPGMPPHVSFAVDDEMEID